MAAFYRDREQELASERSLTGTVSSAVSTVLYPVQCTTAAFYEALPFTKKGCAVLLKVSEHAQVCGERLGATNWLGESFESLLVLSVTMLLTPGVRLQGKPAIESASGGLQHAALTAVRFRGKILETEQQSGRYFLLASYGDPWAQRALIVHGLAGLKESVGIVSTDGLWPIAKGLPAIATRGWKFSPRKQLRSTLLKNCSQDLQRSARRGNIYMHDLYVATDPEATGRVTIPCIWDAAAGKVVNNESGDIVRILHQGLKLLGESGVDLYPAALQDEIERVRQIVYGFNAGVYKCGFAPTPDAHARALSETFAALDACEELLARRQFLAGDRLTECDVLAFPTLIRFDVSYYTAFRCNRRRVRDYPNISRYLEKLYSIKAFRDTVHVPTYVCVHFIEAKWRGTFLHVSRGQSRA